MDQAGTVGHGCVFFDRIIVDDERIIPEQSGADRVLVTKTGFAFTGSNTVRTCQLWASNVDNAVELYDADSLPVSEFDAVVRLTAITSSDVAPSYEANMQFHKGCYVKLIGTNPRALLKLGNGGPSEMESIQDQLSMLQQQSDQQFGGPPGFEYQG